jgi:competence protein ComEA
MQRIALVLITFLSLGAAATAFAQDAPKPPSSSGGTMINLNSATVPQLETLPGIGRSTAERIVEYRQKSGGFKKIEDLMNVQGIGEKSFLKLKPLVTVGAARAERSGQ